MATTEVYRGLNILNRISSLYPYYIICPNWYSRMSITTAPDGSFKSVVEIEKTFRQFLVNRLEGLIQSRDQANLWPFLKMSGLQRKDFDLALKLIRGGVDLHDDRIIAVVKDIDSFDLIREFNSQLSLNQG